MSEANTSDSTVNFEDAVYGLMEELAHCYGDGTETKSGAAESHVTGLDEGQGSSGDVTSSTTPGNPTPKFSMSMRDDNELPTFDMFTGSNEDWTPDAFESYFDSVMNGSNALLPLALDDFSGEKPATTKESPKSEKTKKRPFELRCGLSGSYWQIHENNSFASRPKRAKAGSLLKSLTEPELKPGAEGKKSDKPVRKSRTPVRAQKTKPKKMSIDLAKTEVTPSKVEVAEEKAPTPQMLTSVHADVIPDKEVTPDSSVRNSTTPTLAKLQIPKPKKSATKSIASTPEVQSDLKPATEQLAPIHGQRVKHSPQMENEVPEPKPICSPSPSPPNLKPEIKPKTAPSRRPLSMRAYTKIIPRNYPRSPIIKSEDFTTGIKLDVVSEELALMCIMAIPEDAVPTSHKEYIKLKSSQKSTTVVKKPTSGIPPRSSFTRITKKWDEDEIPEVVQLGNNQLMINKRLVVVDYVNYLKESDVVLDYDKDSSGYSRVLQNTSTSCGLMYCKLGCICDSLKSVEQVRSHCGRPKCFFECCCLFKVPTLIGDDTDIRSRLRPRVSLLDWKDKSRSGIDMDSDMFKARVTPSLKKRILSKPAFVGVPGQRIRRQALPPPRLRNEFVLEDRKRANQTLKSPTIPTLRMTENRSDAPRTLYFKKLQNIAPAPTLPAEVSRPRPLQPAEKASYLPISRKANPRFKRMQGLREWKAKYPVISARYLYNHSLLRRIHKCKPCFVQLYRVDDDNIVAPPTPPRRKYFARRQVAVKSTSRGSLRQKRRKQIVPNRLKVIKSQLLDSNIIMRENGTMIGCLHWSLAKHCVPSARLDALEGFPLIRLPVPPLGMAWVFYELPENYQTSDHILIPELKMFFPTLKIMQKIKESQTKGATCKLEAVHVSDNYRHYNLGTIYILKNLPNILICGPMRKSKVSPMSPAEKRISIQEFQFYLKNTDPFGKTSFNNNPRLLEKRRPSVEMEVDDIPRDADPVPPEVMMREFAKFMIPLNQPSLQFSTNEDWRQNQLEIFTEPDDDYGNLNETDDQLSSTATFGYPKDTNYKGPNDYTPVVTIDDDGNETEEFVQQKLFKVPQNPQQRFLIQPVKQGQFQSSQFGGYSPLVYVLVPT